jgi:hypothetical protein
VTLLPGIKGKEKDNFIEKGIEKNNRSNNANQSKGITL